MSDSQLQVYEVWDKPTRWFHWINVLAIVGLSGLGLVLLNGDSLGLSNDGKILLKKAHVWIGYVFAGNLLVRLLWGFYGNRFTRWSGILPGGSAYFGLVRDYVAGFFGGRPRRYVGHNPIGRISVTVMFLLLITQAMTGLILAGTDIFYPPFGNWIARWIAAEGIDPATLVPYAKATYDVQAYQEMRAFRSPIIATHLYTFYALAAVVIAHVAAVVATEIHEGGNLISAMFTGRKILAEPPQDYADTDGS